MITTSFLEILKQSCADNKIHIALEMFNMTTKLKIHAQLGHVLADPCPRCGWRLGWIPARPQACPVCNAVVRPSNVTPREEMVREFSALII